jgi:hypothetical protein
MKKNKLNIPKTMKHIGVATRLILVLMLMLPVRGMAQEALFEKFNDANGITTIYISKTMLRMVHNVKAWRRPIGNMASKLDELRVLNCERPSMIANIRKQFADYYKKNKYEVVMQAKDDEENVTIYFHQLKGGKAEYALLAEENDEISVIYLNGNITLKDIQQLTGH